MRDDRPTITLHREPPPRMAPEAGKGLGYIRAEGEGVAAILPVTLSLMDDEPEVVDRYIETRLLHFHAIEVERVRNESAE